MAKQEQFKQLADALTEEELAHLAVGGKMTEEERQKIKKIHAITIPTGVVAATAVGLGVAALAGRFGEHKDAGWYFKHPFGTSPYKKWPADQ